MAKKMTKAWEQKDEAAFRSCLHKDYSFNGPMMEMKSADDAVEFMNRCPFEPTSENYEVIVEGQTLVQIFDWKVTAPFQATIPMVEVIEFEGERVKRARLFFDSALFPAEEGSDDDQERSVRLCYSSDWWVRFANRWGGVGGTILVSF